MCGVVPPRAGSRPRGWAPAGSPSAAAAGSSTARSRVWAGSTGSRKAARPTSPPGSSRSSRRRPRPLSVDWDAWAAIIALRYPVGTRTPFAEISRLAPHAAIRRRLGRARVEQPAWPWAEIEPHAQARRRRRRLGRRAARDAGAASARRSCARSAAAGTRACSSAHSPRHAHVTALRSATTRAARFEEEHAVAVAEALGVAHEELGARRPTTRPIGTSAPGASSTSSSTIRGLMPLARRVRGAGAPVLDGMAIDVTLRRRIALLQRELARPAARPRQASLALFETLRGYGHADRRRWRSSFARRCSPAPASSS